MTDIQTALTQAINEWEGVAAPVSVSQATFDYIRDNPGKSKSVVIRELEARGFKPTSTTTLISAMLRQKLVKIDADKRLTTLVKSYAPIQANKKHKAKKLPSLLVVKPSQDPVNHPSHYMLGGIETIDFIEAKQLGYNLGNVVKYITRADHKGNQLQDLQKAQWYLAREIERVQA
jgi:hypothetical protein